MCLPILWEPDHQTAEVPLHWCEMLSKKDLDALEDSENLTHVEAAAAKAWFEEAPVPIPQLWT